jgi:acetamidase/formamidase
MVRWLSGLYGIDDLDAYQLLSQVSDVPLANVVDTNYSALTRVPRALLPAVEVYGGVHARLRAAAASL